MSTPPPGLPGLPGRLKIAFASLRRPDEPAQPASEPRFNPSSWGGAIIVMIGFGAALWIVQIVNHGEGQGLDRFGIRPREIAGLWGVLTAPFLHSSWNQLVSNTFPVVLIGWAVLLSGIRVWGFVTVCSVLIGGLATWVVAPSGHPIVGAGGLVFAWLGYLMARAYFSRRIKWILTAVGVLLIFGALLGSLIPAPDAHASWAANVCGFLTGGFLAWLLHPRHRPANGRSVAR